jgi:hypothetical protein
MFGDVLKGSPMTPEEAARKIREAVTALESGSRADSKAAYEFLHKVPDEYRVAIDEFQRALRSTSSDARSEAGTALAKFGRGEAWVLPALKEAYVQETEGYVLRRHAFSIASVETAEAATVLVELLEQALEADSYFSAISLCEALSAMGDLTAHELQNLSRLDTFYRRQVGPLGYPKEDVQFGITSDYLHKVHHQLVQAVMSSYTSYSLHAPKDLVAGTRPLLGLDSLDLDRSGPRYGDFTLVFDQRVDYRVGSSREKDKQISRAAEHSSSKRAGATVEIRCVLFEREPNKFVCIAVWDHFASASIINQYEDFATSVLKSLFLDIKKILQLEFGIFQPVLEESFTGEYTGVDLALSENPLRVSAWLPDVRFDQIFKDSSSDVRALLCKSPPIPEGFKHFIRGREQDSLIDARLSEMRSSSPDGRLHYTELTTPFSAHVAEAIRTGINPVAQPARICGDSLDPAGNEEFFARALPKPIRDVLSECQRAVREAKAHRHRKIGVIEWPDLESVPSEYIAHAPRPYELDAMDGTPQVALALDPATHGVIMFRCQRDGVTVVVTNIPFSVLEHAETFNWGFKGLASYNLAKNIINAFVPPGSDGKPEREARESYWGAKKRTFASYTADKIAEDFYTELLTKLPGWSGYISAQRMREWILGKAVALYER